MQTIIICLSQGIHELYWLNSILNDLSLLFPIVAGIYNTKIWTIFF